MKDAWQSLHAASHQDCSIAKTTNVARFGEDWGVGPLSKLIKTKRNKAECNSSTPFSWYQALLVAVPMCHALHINIQDHGEVMRRLRFNMLGSKHRACQNSLNPDSNPHHEAENMLGCQDLNFTAILLQLPEPR